MKDPMSARTRLGAWWRARRWKAPDDCLELVVAADLGVLLADLYDHAMEILANPDDAPDPTCPDCVLADARGVWAELGFPKPFDPDDLDG